MEYTTAKGKPLAQSDPDSVWEPVAQKLGMTVEALRAQVRTADSIIEEIFDEERKVAPKKARAEKLSTPQIALMMRLAEIAPEVEESPFGGGSMAKIYASAWHRTVDSLHRKGLVLRERFGDHYSAKLTDEGRAWLFANGAS